MQNFLPSVMPGMAQSRWIKDSDLLYPCDAVAQRDQRYCWLMVAHRILPAVNYDWTKASAWCRRTRGDAVRLCFDSLGFNAADADNNVGTGVVKICSHTGNMEAECINAATRNIANADANGVKASRLCASDVSLRIRWKGYRPTRPISRGRSTATNSIIAAASSPTKRCFR